MSVVRVNTSNHIFNGCERKVMLEKVINFVSQKNNKPLGQNKEH